MARFIVLKGNPNSGKTYTMWMVYHMLSCLSKDAKVKHEFKLGEDSWRSFYEPNPIAFNDCNATDFMAKLNINGQKIGMISEGDEVKPLENKINELLKENIDVIICCVRARNTKNSTFRMFVTKFVPTYTHVWINLNKISNKISYLEQIKCSMDIVKHL